MSLATLQTHSCDVTEKPNRTDICLKLIENCATCNLVELRGVHISSSSSSYVLDPLVPNRLCLTL